jgi:DNA-binding transcriptional MocR family regulator
MTARTVVSHEQTAASNSWQDERVTDRIQQQQPRPGIIELGFGEPDLTLLPTPVIEQCCRDAVARHGHSMLAYGLNEGPPHLRRLIAERVTRREGRCVDLETLIVTGGNSHGFAHILDRFVDHDDVVFVEQPTYSLGLWIVRDRGASIEPIDIDQDGLIVGLLEERLRAVRRDGRRPRLLYTVPTFHNPAGVSLADERRRRLVELAAAEDLLIVEDDAYRDLWYDEPAPPSLWSLAPEGTVLRLGSFSKVIAPGLRTGWLTAAPAQVERYATCGLMESGGHVSWFSTFVTAQFLAEDLFDDHVAMLRSVYAERRDALCEALQRELPAGCRFVRPAGGFFIRLLLPPGMSATRLLPIAESHGVAFVPGTRNRLAGGDDSLRLGFTLYKPAELREGAARLAAAVEEAAASR